MNEYRRIYRLREAAAALSSRARKSNGNGTPTADSVVQRFGKQAVATGFAWMFSGARLPAAPIVDLALSGAERWLARRAAGGPS